MHYCTTIDFIFEDLHVNRKKLWLIILQRGLKFISTIHSQPGYETYNFSLGCLNAFVIVKKFWINYRILMLQALRLYCLM